MSDSDDTTAVKSTAERLEEALASVGLSVMAERASRFVYDDFKGETAAPQSLLLADLEDAARGFRRRGLFSREQTCRDLIQRVLAGEFDGTKKEAQDWAEKESDPELRRIMGVDQRKPRTDTASGGEGKN